MEKYKQISYLLGCYMVISDNEINALEVEVLERYLTVEPSDSLYSKKQLIFSDDETSPSLSYLLSELTLINLTKDQKYEIIRLLADIAYGDEYLAVQEKDLLFKVAKSLNLDPTPIMQIAEKDSKKRLDAMRLSFAQRTIGNVENFIYNHIPGQKSDNTIDLLLGSLGYSASIEKITDDALIDLDRVSKILNDINGSLIITEKSINNLKFKEKNSSKEVEKVAKIVSEIKDSFEKLIDFSFKENITILDKKRRNIRYFTIAFMGRTKAGKSTFHKVITQQQNDDIGVGKLRTTRYNRSWYWNKLRIVDTPGIGAPGGATDTEIAKSIIDEADIICYIVTSDSIQETEFDFFETIKERNKPLYIVLNVKSNLTQSIRLKRFIENPNAWKDSTGPQSIQGHLDRIHERLDGKYNMDAVEIIPIHLLAAMLGFSNNLSPEDSNILRQSSNIFTFTRSVKYTVQISGGIKKSLSVVDGTAYQIHKITSLLNDDLTNLKEGHNILTTELEKFNFFIKKEKEKLFEDIKTIFQNARAELNNRAAAFASEYYDRNDANTLWENDSVVKSIYLRMNNFLKHRIDDFNDIIKSHIEEIREDIQILVTFKAKSNVIGEDIINTRLGVGVFGTILTVAITVIISQIWNPVGWIMFVVSGVMATLTSIFTSLTTSKTEKIKKATEIMHNQLCKIIEKNINKNQSDFLSNIDNSITKTISSISSLFITYINGTNQIITNIQNLCKKCEEGESAINSLVSFRILEYVGKNIIKDNNIGSIENSTLIMKYPVIRNWANQSLTFKYDVKLSPKEISKINQATQMKILN